jgi:hypothetical protein
MDALGSGRAEVPLAALDPAGDLGDAGHHAPRAAEHDHGAILAAQRSGGRACSAVLLGRTFLEGVRDPVRSRGSEGMDAGERGSRAPAWRVAVVLALLGVLVVPVTAARAGEYDTVGADGQCFYGRDKFRDTDGNGCAEPLVEAGDVRLRFVASGSGRALRIEVTSLTLRVGDGETVFGGCSPRCRPRVQYDGERAEVGISRTFRYGELIGVRVWRDGHVGRFFGYRIKKRRPQYIACLIRSPKGAPQRCHT